MIAALQDPILAPRARSEGRTSSEGADTSFEAFLTSSDTTLGPVGSPSDQTGQSPHGIAAIPVDIEASAGGGEGTLATDARSEAAVAMTGLTDSPSAPDYAERPADSCDKDRGEEVVEPLSFPADSLVIVAQPSPRDGPSPRRQDNAPGTSGKPATVSLTETAAPAADDEAARGRRQSPRHSADAAGDSRVRLQTAKAAPDSPAHGSERGAVQLPDSSAPASAPIDGRAADAPQASRVLDSARVPGGFSQKKAEGAEPAVVPTAGQPPHTQPAFAPGQPHGASPFPSLAALQVHYAPPEQVSLGVDRAAQPTSPQWRNRIEPGQVARQIAQGVGNSRTGRIEIVLHPEELGKVRMVMTPGENPSVTIQADNTDTLELLRRNVDQLSRELRQSGFGEASLSFADEGDRRAPLRPALMQAGSGARQDLPGSVRPDPKAEGGQSRAPQRQLDIRI